jgi:hypothetical protein
VRSISSAIRNERTTMQTDPFQANPLGRGQLADFLRCSLLTYRFRYARRSRVHLQCMLLLGDRSLGLRPRLWLAAASQLAGHRIMFCPARTSLNMASVNQIVFGSVLLLTSSGQATASCCILSGRTFKWRSIGSTTSEIEMATDSWNMRGSLRTVWFSRVGRTLMILSFTPTAASQKVRSLSAKFRLMSTLRNGELAR